MKAVLVNYNFTPDWLKDYPEIDYYIYDRSDSKDFLKDFDQSKIRYTENLGQVDYDKLTYLVEFYDQLPEVFLWGKTNLFKYITKEEFDWIKNSTTLTPLLTKNHPTYIDRLGQVNYFDKGLYWERNLGMDGHFAQFNYKYLVTFGEFAHEFQLPNPTYIPFAPGGNYILTREVVHKYSRDYYDKMRNCLSYCQLPREAQFVERAYYLMWGENVL